MPAYSNSSQDSPGCAINRSLRYALEATSPRERFVFPAREGPCRAVRAKQRNALRLAGALFDSLRARISVEVRRHLPARFASISPPRSFWERSRAWACTLTYRDPNTLGAWFLC